MGPILDRISGLVRRHRFFFSDSWERDRRARNPRPQARRKLLPIPIRSPVEKYRRFIRSKADAIILVPKWDRLYVMLLAEGIWRESLSTVATIAVANASAS